ncbi:MAG: hypothetical protein WC815_11975 [Vicinamibacterales bacterium]|jgi:hypothetical protein
MTKRLAREVAWLGVSILAAGLTILVITIANDAPQALDAFAGFAAFVAGITTYAFSVVARITIWAISGSRSE